MLSQLSTHTWSSRPSKQPLPLQIEAAMMMSPIAPRRRHCFVAYWLSWFVFVNSWGRHWLATFPPIPILVELFVSKLLRWLLCPGRMQWVLDLDRRRRGNGIADCQWATSRRPGRPLCLSESRGDQWQRCWRPKNDQIRICVTRMKKMVWTKADWQPRLVWFHPAEGMQISYTASPSWKAIGNERIRVWYAS